MTKDDFIRALREVESEEFADVPKEDEIDCEFSENFIGKMSKMVSDTEYKRSHTISKTAKRVIVVVAILVMLLIGTMSVSAFREPIIEFMTNIYEEYIEVFFTPKQSRIIEHIYSFETVPEGFNEISRRQETDLAEVEYENPQNGELIILRQSSNTNSTVRIDNERGDITQTVINGNQAIIYENQAERMITVRWINDSYSMKLTYYGNITKDEIIKLISTIS